MACMHGSPVDHTCPICALKQSEDTLAEDIGKMSGPFIEYGWACPKCSSVYAPHVRKCEHCGPGN